MIARHHPQPAAARRLRLSAGTPMFMTLAVAVLAAGFSPVLLAAPAGNNAAADAFRTLTDDTWIERRETLASLGITSPLVLASNDSSRELDLPVPSNVPL
ncbi:hypothetical protein ABTA35_19610, partial [Acinetobacter baumannii]